MALSIPWPSTAPLVGDVARDGIWEVVRALSEMTSLGRASYPRPKAGPVAEQDVCVPSDRVAAGQTPVRSFAVFHPQ